MVPHRRLIHKLRAYGLGECLLEWVKDFLSDREQRVVLGETVSEWASVTSGVPQGSVIGPILFLVYINDLPKVLLNICKLFADDSKLIANIGKIDSLDELAIVSVQNDINAISRWTKDWLMCLNASKCKVVHLGKENHKTLEPRYQIEDIKTGTMNPLSRSDCERDLGVSVASDLSWSVHIRTITCRANRILGQLKNTFTCRDTNLWCKIYTSLVRPHLEFAVQAWCPFLLQDIEMIEKVQKRALRIPHELRKLKNHDQRLEEVGLTTLEERRKRGDLIQLYKLINGLEIVDNSCFPKPAPSLKYLGPEPSIRGNSMKIERELFNAKDKNKYARFTTLRHNFFSNRVTNIWNELPDIIIKAPTINYFKAGLDNFFSK